MWSKLCLINEPHLAAGVTKPGNSKCWGKKIILNFVWVNIWINPQFTKIFPQHCLNAQNLTNSILNIFENTLRIKNHFPHIYRLVRIYRSLPEYFKNAQKNIRLFENTLNPVEVLKIHSWFWIFEVIFFRTISIFGIHNCGKTDKGRCGLLIFGIFAISWHGLSNRPRVLHKIIPKMILICLNLKQIIFVLHLFFCS